MAVLPAWVGDWWRSMDTAPMDGTEILACWKASNSVGVVYYSASAGANGERWADESGQYVSVPTHWMPLPPLPR